MSLIITPEAAACFTEVWGYQVGESIRVYVRYSSGSSEAFAFGITRDRPQSAALTAEQGGVTFFMEQDDVWFLENRDLLVDCGQDRDIVFKLT